MQKHANTTWTEIFQKEKPLKEIMKEKAFVQNRWERSLKHHSQLTCFVEENMKWSLFRKAQLKTLSCIVTPVSGLFEKHTHRQWSTWNTPLHHPDWRVCLEQEREMNAKLRTDRLFQQSISQIYGQDLTCPGFQAQRSDCRLACKFSWHCSPISLTHTHYIFCNPLQKPFTAISQGGGWRPCQQAALAAKQAGERWPALSTGSLPQPATLQLPSCPWKRQAWQQLILCVAR